MDEKGTFILFYRVVLSRSTFSKAINKLKEIIWKLLSIFWLKLCAYEYGMEMFISSEDLYLHSRYLCIDEANVMIFHWLKVKGQEFADENDGS